MLETAGFASFPGFVLRTSAFVVESDPWLLPVATALSGLSVMSSQNNSHRPGLALASQQGLAVAFPSGLLVACRTETEKNLASAFAASQQTVAVVGAWFVGDPRKTYFVTLVLAWPVRTRHRKDEYRR